MCDNIIQKSFHALLLVFIVTVLFYKEQTFMLCWRSRYYFWILNYSV